MKTSFTYLILISINIANLSFSVCSKTIYDSMATAYANSPKLKALRAKLKASDEEISKVLSSKRPIISFSGNYGKDNTTTINTSGVESTIDNIPASVELEIKQNLYDSGRSKYNLSKTDSMIFAERAELASMEQKILLSTIEVYLDLFTAVDLNKLAKNNLSVLKQHLNATESRFEVGEVTATDLSQARARYLKARANEIKSKGDVKIQKSKYFSIIGKEAPETLIFPESYPNLPNTLKEAIQLAIKNNPKVVSSGFRKKSSFLDISLAASNLLPRLDLNLSAQNAWDPNTFFDEYKNYSIDLSLNIPLYQGGKNYANVRKKKNLAIEKSRNFDSEIRETVKDVEVVWLSLKNTQYQIKAIESSIFASNTALKGVREEERVGTRTTLDVLDAEQELLEEKMVLVNTKKDLLFFSFQMLENIGMLTPQNLNLDIEVYDKNAYYNKIKKLWLGFEPN